MLGGFILTFVGAGIFDVANGAPLTPLQILWINFAVDVLLAIGLGFDAPAPGLMRRAPRGRERTDRRPSARHPARRRRPAAWRSLALGVVAWGEHRYDLVVATTMGLTTLSLMHIVAALEAREPTGDDLQSRHDREPPVHPADRRGAGAHVPRHRRFSPCSGSSTPSR